MAGVHIATIILFRGRFVNGEWCCAPNLEKNCVFASEFDFLGHIYIVYGFY